MPCMICVANERPPPEPGEALIMGLAYGRRAPASKLDELTAAFCERHRTDYEQMARDHDRVVMVLDTFAKSPSAAPGRLVLASSGMGGIGSGAGAPSRRRRL